MSVEQVGSRPGRQRSEPLAETTHGARLYAPTPGRPTYYRITWRTKTGEPKGLSAGRDFQQAVRKLGEVERMLSTDLGDVGEQRFAEVIDDFLGAAEHNADSYQTQHKRMVKTYIRPVLGNVPAWDLSRSDVEKVLGRATSKSEAVKLRATMGSMLTWAHGQAQPRIAQPREHYIVRAPRNARTSGGGRHQGTGKLFIPERERPHPLACKALADAMFSQRVGRSAEAAWLMVALASGSGPREGELWAFRRADFDFDTHEVSVERQVVALNGGGYVETLPKWGKVRTTFIPERTIWGEPLEGRLWDYLQRVPEDVEGPDLVEPPFASVSRHRGRAPWLAFPTTLGCYWSAGNWGSREFGQAKSTLPLPTTTQPLGWRPRWKWHSLRHAFCWFMLSADEKTGKVAAELTDVADAAGHENTHTTAAMYVGSTQGQAGRLRSSSAR